MKQIKRSKGTKRAWVRFQRTVRAMGKKARQGGRRGQSSPRPFEAVPVPWSLKSFNSSGYCTGLKRSGQ